MCETLKTCKTRFTFGSIALLIVLATLHSWPALATQCPANSAVKPKQMPRILAIKDEQQNLVGRMSQLSAGIPVFITASHVLEGNSPKAVLDSLAAAQSFHYRPYWPLGLRPHWQFMELLTNDGTPLDIVLTYVSRPMREERMRYDLTLVLAGTGIATPAKEGSPFFFQRFSSQDLVEATGAQAQGIVSSVSEPYIEIPANAALTEYKGTSGGLLYTTSDEDLACFGTNAWQFRGLITCYEKDLSRIRAISTDWLLSSSVIWREVSLDELVKKKTSIDNCNPIGRRGAGEGGDGG